MASQNFKDLVSRTENLEDSVTKELLIKTVSMQDDINKQLSSVKKDYSKNRKIYNLLYEEVNLLKSKSNKPVYDKLKNPLERKEGSGGGGGLLSALFGGLAAAKMFLMPILSKIVSSIISKAGGLGKALLNLLKKGGKSAIRGAANIAARTASALKGSVVRGAGALARGGLRGVASSAVRMGGSAASKFAVRQVAMFIGRGVAGAAAAAAGTPLLIAAAAAAVGYGSYKLGRYLKLSEKLDDFIKKVSSGKYNSLVDFILGLVDGSVGKDLFSWVKTKIDTLFTDSMTYLKNKTNEILGKWSPFIDDPTTLAGGAEPDAPTEDVEKTEVEKTKANDTFRAQMASGASGSSIQMDMLEGAKNYTNKTPVMMRGVEGYNSGNVSSAPSANSGGLAWKAITKGQNTVIRSRFGKRKGSAQVSSDHTGLDIEAGIGTPIYAPESGTVTRDTNVAGGIQAFLKGESGTKYGFAHLSEVTASGKVTAGTQIAKSGNTGTGTTGPHIHLSVRPPGSNDKINPEGYMIPGGAKSAAGGIGDDTHSVTSAVGQDIEYANGFSQLRGVSSNIHNNAVAPTSKAPRPRNTNMQASSSEQASFTKSGAISGKVGTVKDPRGAMSADILMASMSPLFV